MCYLKKKKNMEISQTKRKSIDYLSRTEVKPYNAGERNGLPSRAYIEVMSTVILEEAWKKKMLWVLVYLHAKQKQCASGWTGFNILICDDVDVLQDSIGYLPTIDAPATDMSTVHEIPVRSLKIKDNKAIAIQWKHSDKFSNKNGCIPKCFQDGGLRNMAIESGVVAEGSLSGVIDGRRYN